MFVCRHFITVLIQLRDDILIRIKMEYFLHLLIELYEPRIDLWDLFVFDRGRGLTTCIYTQKVSSLSSYNFLHVQQ